MMDPRAHSASSHSRWKWTADLLETWGERAAILEYEAGMRRQDAERVAEEMIKGTWKSDSEPVGKAHREKPAPEARK
jgi:hypothetical protein